MIIDYPSRPLPVLSECDYAVAGGSLAGVAAALALAQAGRSVTLIEPRTYLGRDLTAELHPWLDLDGPFLMPPLLQDLAASAGSVQDAAGVLPLRMDALKLRLEDLLLETGVKLVYGSYALQVCVADGRLGLVIGNKSGRQVVLCGQLIDATETALLARLSRASFDPAGGTTQRFTRTLAYTGVPAGVKSIPVPERLGLASSTLRLYQLPGEGGQACLEIDLAFPDAENTYKTLMERELAARRKSLELALYLRQEEPLFARAVLASAAYELRGFKTTSLSGDLPGWAAAYHEHRLMLPQREGDLSINTATLAGPLTGLWCLNPAARLGDNRSLMLDPAASAWIGQGLGQWLAGEAAPVLAGIAQQVNPVMREEAGGWQVSEPDSPQRGRNYLRRALPAQRLAVYQDCQVLVAGGGTAGAAAAAASGVMGMETVVVEMNPGLGGTGTLGGVPEYWMGYRGGMNAEIERRVSALDDALGYVAPDRWRQWSLEGKMGALLQLVEENHAGVCFYALCTAAIVDGPQVRGLVAATPYGPLAFLGQVVIDATGDGDIASFAGAESVYGNERDATVLWTSLPQLSQPGMPKAGNFTSSCDVRNVEDTTRAILAGRRRGGTLHDHGPYLAPRESRHIWGDAALTFTDMLLHRRWPDVICLFYSNYDIKGRSTTDWNLAGLISANLVVELPYRAVLPRGLEGILVTGKAFSAHGNAAPLARMQPDIENLGAAAGTAGAMAVRLGVTPRALPVSLLQERLVAAGLLPRQVTSRSLKPRRLGPDEIRRMIDRLDAAQPLYEINNRPEQEVMRDRIPFAEVCTAGPAAVPLLAQALESADGPRQVLLAQALAMCGDPTGAPILVEKISELLGDAGLPVRTAFILNTARHLPDHAAMPDAAYLIYSLGMAPTRAALPVWDQVIARLDFNYDDFCDPYKAPYYYVDAVCYGAERLGDLTAVPMLKRLHQHSLLRGQVCRQGAQPDYMLERLAVLELVIGRALARCGSPDGYTILIDYLHDSRALLAEHAHAELARISAEDFGKDELPWREWLTRNQQYLSPRPWRQKTDAVRAWDEEMLVDDPGT